MEIRFGDSELGQVDVALPDMFGSPLQGMEDRRILPPDQVG